ncbi:MAG TPA: NAD-dependent epimerase/dehydratase family protein [Anaeromyxobacteraceae bacterium]|nr:NAD-dependent epimerase/dehydratase family protein [Anaeromyxobacteraceae bacterium]
MADARMHVVFGAGQIGPLLAAKLRDAGQRVRVVRRSPTPVPVEGIEALHGDATDPAFVAEATRGAAVVYHCINSPYFAKVWAETLPRIQANLIFGAGKAGARLVVLDNLYAYGRTHGRPMDEQTPLAPCSRKGEIRARLSEDLAAAAKRGEVRVVVGRASDFFGPGAWAGSFLGAPFWPRVLAGKSGILLFDPDVRHTYHFSRDVAAGLAALGLDAGAEGLWMLPCQTAQTTRELVARCERALGRPIEIRRLPRAALAALGLLVPQVRELSEMAYQWEEPFVVDDARFRARFTDLSTPLDEAAAQTVDYAREMVGRKRAPV